MSIITLVFIMDVFLIWMVVVTVQASEDEESWNNFQVKYNKTYKNEAEKELRQKIFNENLEKIKEHNIKYRRTLVYYKLGVNKFADMTEKEFNATLETNGTFVLITKKDYMLDKTITEEPPESIDWRTKGVVTGVKDQGNCGACWAFSSTGTLEGQLAIQTGKLVSLSQQQLLDCDTVNFGCNGGSPSIAINYVTENGLVLEEDYPYKEKNGACSVEKIKNPVVWTKGYVVVKGNNEINLKQAVGVVGPISVGIDAKSLQFYKEGIFDGACSTGLNHGILAVGYGKDDKIGVEYWIMKNSWGKDWGEQGYFRMRMGRNLCGVASVPTYPVLLNNSLHDSGNSIKGNLLCSIMLFIYLYL